MKAVMVIGSRNPEGQTARAAKGLGAGLQSEGVDVEEVYLPEITLERCRQCENDGWGTCRSEGSCVIDDDFAGLVDRLAEADVAVFATPVYFGDLSESLRAFLDRLRRTSIHEAGKARVAGTPAFGICVAGGGGGGAPTCVVSLDKVLNTCGFDLVDVVPARRQNLDLKVEVLETSGRWLAGYVGTVKES
ncbi:flavodoxin family protein [Candidatus Latescibacterota bacterium]